MAVALAVVVLALALVLRGCVLVDFCDNALVVVKRCSSRVVLAFVFFCCWCFGDVLLAAFWRWFGGSWRCCGPMFPLCETSASKGAQKHVKT